MLPVGAGIAGPDVSRAKPEGMVGDALETRLVFRSRHDAAIALERSWTFKPLASES